MGGGEKGKEKQEEEGEKEEEQQGDEEVGEEKEERGVGGERRWGSHADFNCSSINTKLPAVRDLNRDQTARKNGERRVIFSTQDGTAFFDLAGLFY